MYSVFLWARDNGLKHFLIKHIGGEVWGGMRCLFIARDKNSLRKLIPKYGRCLRGKKNLLSYHYCFSSILLLLFTFISLTRINITTLRAKITFQGLRRKTFTVINYCYSEKYMDISIKTQLLMYIILESPAYICSAYRQESIF